MCGSGKQEKHDDACRVLSADEEDRKACLAAQQLALSAGVIGLPDVGKTTVFNALTGGGIGSNLSVCTVDSNSGTAPVPDPRLNTLTDIFKSKKTTYRTLEVRDIAWLIEGANKGEGLAQFLGHLREVDGLLHVVRCFQENDAVHVSTGVNPISDISVTVTELMPADPEALDRRKQRGRSIPA
jgi:ribosome-binding ATPase YchF (GTP1/OBG family)